MRTALLAAVLLLACPPAPGVVCRTHDTCKSLEDGYCSRAEICTRECDGERPCPEGSVCSAEGSRSVCLPSCTSSDTCPPGFACEQSSAGALRCHLARPLDAPP